MSETNENIPCYTRWLVAHVQNFQRNIQVNFYSFGLNYNLIFADLLLRRSCLALISVDAFQFYNTLKFSLDEKHWWISSWYNYASKLEMKLYNEKTAITTQNCNSQAQCNTSNERILDGKWILEDKWLAIFVSAWSYRWVAVSSEEL